MKIINKNILKRKLIAAFLSIFFICDSAIAAPLPNPDIRADIPSLAQAQLLFNLQIPEELALVQSRYFPDRAKAIMPPETSVVLHIQDAHAHPEAQRHIAALLLHLHEAGQLNRVAVEGAFGRVDPKILNLLPYPDINQNMAEFLLDMGELTGAELFAVKASSGIPVQGIEDPKLYQESFVLFRELKAGREKWANPFAAYETLFDQIKIQNLNPALRDFIVARHRWKETDGDLMEYIKVLRKYAKSYLSLSLENAEEQFDWPNLSRLVRLSLLESSLQPEISRKEAGQLGEDLFRKGIPEFSDRANDRRSELKAGLEAMQKNEIPFWLMTTGRQIGIQSFRHFIELLDQELVRHRLLLTDYPHFIESAKFLILREEINSEHLFQEVGIFEQEVLEAVTENDREKEIISLDDDLLLLKKLFNLTLTFHQYDEYRSKPMAAKLQDILERLEKLAGNSQQLVRIPEDLWKKAERFYELTLERDRTLFEKVMDLAKQTERETSAGVVVLIAGGFHTPGLEAQFRGKGMPYLTVRPKMTRFDQGELYEKAMMGENAASMAVEVENQYLVKQLLLQAAELYQQGGLDVSEQRNLLRRALEESAIPSLREKGISEEQIALILREVENDFPELMVDDSEDKREASQTTTPEAIKAEFVSLEDLMPIAWTAGPGVGAAAVTVLQDRSSARSESRNMDIASTQDMTAEEELAYLQETVLPAFKRELKRKGRGNIPKVVYISDQHGTIEKFDEFILDAMRSVLPPDKQIPEGFKLDPKKRLEDQLAYFGISLADDFDGKLYFMNLGDFMDRGKYGLKVFFRAFDLIRAGLSDYVIGNHDKLVLDNLEGSHLPWYENYNFYGYTDEFDALENGGNVEALVREAHKSQPETRTKSWWARKLAEFMAYKDAQSEKWKSYDILVRGQWDASGKKRVPGTGLYAQVSATLSPHQRKLWNKLRGWHLVDVYTGVAAPGKVSLKWWRELLADFEEAYASIGGDFEPDLPANQAWRQAIAMMRDEIIPQLHEEIVERLEKGEWWWRVFEAINYKNYESAEWNTMDWLFHPGWGPSILSEMNEDIPNEEDKVTPANYLENEILQHVADTLRDYFRLYVRDIYQTTAMHAFLPTDKHGNFYFTYKDVTYRGKGYPEQNEPSIWQGLREIEKDIQDHTHSLRDNYEAYSLVSKWYADSTTESKPSDILHLVNHFGADHIAEVNGFNRLVTGHIPFHQFSAFTEDQRGVLSGFLTGQRIAISDHGMGERYGDRGAYIMQSPDGFYLRGFESSQSQTMVDHPRTVHSTSGTTGVVEEVLFENPGIERREFLKTVIADIEIRIEELEKQIADEDEGETEKQRSETREIPEYIEKFLLEKLNIPYKELTEAEQETVYSHLSFFEAINSFGAWASGKMDQFRDPDKIYIRGHLSSSNDLEEAVMKSELFNFAVKEDGRPDDSENAWSLRVMGTLLSARKVFQTEESVQEDFEPAYRIAFKIIQEMLRKDQSFATTYYAVSALKHFGMLGVDTLLLYSAPGIDNQIQSEATGGLRSIQGVTPYLIQRILNESSPKGRKLFSQILVRVGQGDINMILKLLSADPQAEQQLLSLLDGYVPGIESFIDSRFYFPLSESNRKKKILDQMARLSRFKDFLGPEAFQKLLQDFGFDAVSHWSNIEDYREKEKSFDILLSLQRENHLQSALVEALNISLDQNRPEEIRNLLLLLLEGGVFRQAGILSLIDVVTKNPKRASYLIDFLIIYLTMIPLDISEGDFVQENISRLLNADIGPVYYRARKLAENIPHATNVRPGAENELRQLSAELDEGQGRKNLLFHVIRLELHREPSSRDLDLIPAVLDALISLYHPIPEKRITDEQLDSIFGDVIHEEAKRGLRGGKGVYDELKTDQSAAIADVLFEMMHSENIRPENYGSQHFTRRTPNWDALPEPIKNSEAFGFAKRLVEIHQAIQRRYAIDPRRIESLVPNEVKQMVENGQLTEALQAIHALRETNKRKLLAERSLEIDRDLPVKRHIVEDEFGYLSVAFYAVYNEFGFNLFEDDRVLLAYLESLHDQNLSQAFALNRRNVKEWAAAHRHERPASLPEAPPKRRTYLDSDLSELVEKMIADISILIDQMALDGLASERLRGLIRILQRESLDIQQLRNVLTLVQDETVRMTDYFNYHFSDFPQQLALSLGPQNVHRKYQMRGNENDEQRWSQRVQETVLVDLYVQERSLTQLQKYLDGLLDVLKTDLYPWSYFALRGPRKAKQPLITVDNFSEEISPVQIGGKAYHLFELDRKGHVIPPRAVLNAELAQNKKLTKRDARFRKTVLEALLHLEKLSGKTFPFIYSRLTKRELAFIDRYRDEHQSGKSDNLLQVSVRSGSFISMPGMMETVLNVPMTTELVREMIRKEPEQALFYLHNYRRFLMHYGTVHHGMNLRDFTAIEKDFLAELEEREESIIEDADALAIGDLEVLIAKFEALIIAKEPEFSSKGTFELVLDIVIDIYKSWDNPRAVNFRKYGGISERFGTAVIIQQMVYGNLTPDSGTGVIFTRDAATGARVPVGNWKWNAQGTDVVSGLAETAVPLSQIQGPGSLEETHPELYEQLLNLAALFPDDMDLEVTKEQDQIYLLQARSMEIADREEKKKLVQDSGHVRFAAQGRPVSPYAAVGRIIDARNKTIPQLLSEVQQLRNRMDTSGERDLDVILVFDYVTDDDANALLEIFNRFDRRAVAGIINSKVGMSNHASLIARRLGLAYVSDVEFLEFPDGSDEIMLGGETISTGMNGPIISVDGYPETESITSGQIIWGAVPTEIIKPAGLVVRSETRQQPDDLRREIQAVPQPVALRRLPEEVTDARAVEFYSFNRQMIALFDEWKRARETKDDAYLEILSHRIQQYTEFLQPFIQEVKSQNSEEAAYLVSLEQKSPAEWQNQAQALADTLRLIEAQFGEAQARGDLQALDRLNQQMIDGLKRRLKMQLLRLHHELSQIPVRQGPFFMILGSVIRIYESLSTEHYWKRRRSEGEKKILKFRMGDATGHLVFNLFYEKQPVLRVERDRQGSMVLKQIIWKYVDVRGGPRTLQPILTDLAFENLDSSYRSRIHALVNIEEDYAQLIYHDLALQDVLETLRKYEDVPAEVKERIQNIIALALQGPQNKHGLASRRKRERDPQNPGAMLPMPGDNLNAALTLIDNGDTKTASALIESARKYIDARLRSLEKTKEGTERKRDYVYLLMRDASVREIFSRLVEELSADDFNAESIQALIESFEGIAQTHFRFILVPEDYKYFQRKIAASRSALQTLLKTMGEKRDFSSQRDGLVLNAKDVLKTLDQVAAARQRSESREIRPEETAELRAAYDRLQQYLGADRAYEFVRRVSVNVTEKFAPVIPQDLVPDANSFLQWDLFTPFFEMNSFEELEDEQTDDARDTQIGIDMQILDTLPADDDFYHGLAAVLRREKNLFMALFIVEGDEAAVQMRNHWFQSEYGDLAARFRIEAVTYEQLGKQTQKAVEKIHKQAKKYIGLSVGNMADLYERTALSSRRLEFLDQIKIRARWRVLDDIENRHSGIQVYRTYEQARLALDYLPAERIKELQKIMEFRIISASRDLIGSKDLGVIEKAFMEAIAARAFYAAA